MKWFAIVLLLLALLVGGAVGFYHSAWFQSRLAGWAGDKLGREVSIDGELGLEWTWPPAFTATRVRVANADWADPAHMLVIRRVWLQPDPGALLQGRIVIPVLRLHQPRLYLERRRDRRNWAFLTQQGQGGGGGLPTIRRLDLQDGELHLAAPPWDTRIDLTVSQDDSIAGAARTIWGDGYALRLDGDGRLRGEPVSVAAASGPLLELLYRDEQDPPWPVRLDLTTGNTRLQAQGHLSQPRQFTGWDLALSAQGPDPATLSALAGLPLPLQGPYRIEGRVLHEPGRWALRELAGRLGTLSLSGQGRLDRRDDEMSLRLALGEARLELEGRIQALAGLEGLDARLQLNLPQPQRLAQVITPLPAALPAFAASARISHRDQTWQLAQLDGSVGGLSLGGRVALVRGQTPQISGRLHLGNSDLAGEAQLDLAAAPPTLQGDLRSEMLDLVQMQSLLGGGMGGEDEGDGDLFPALPLYHPLLTRMNGQLSYQADQVRLSDRSPGQLRLDLALKDGRLQVSPLVFDLLDGRLRLNAEVQGPEPVRVSSRTRVTRLDLHEFLGGTRMAGKIAGELSGQVNVDGPGRTLDRLLTQAEGDGRLALRDGRLDKELVEKIGVNLFEMLAADSQATVPLRCALAAFQLNQGVARFTTLLLATADTRIIGRGTVDLGDGGLDMVVQPQPRDPGLFDLSATVRVSGTLGSPSISPSVDLEGGEMDADSAERRCREPVGNGSG